MLLKTLKRTISSVLMLSLLLSLISLPVGAQHVTEFNATEVDVAETLVRRAFPNLDQ